MPSLAPLHQFVSACISLKGIWPAMSLVYSLQLLTGPLARVASLRALRILTSVSFAFSIPSLTLGNPDLMCATNVKSLSCVFSMSKYSRIGSV